MISVNFIECEDRQAFMLGGFIVLAKRVCL